ncbi:MAG TPA: hypothetical protein VMU90_09320 [Solirubrobacteraceae bacterium]|nr:hypothetical protein [Solirubrobacteraceae bacterium]
MTLGRLSATCLILLAACAAASGSAPGAAGRLPVSSASNGSVQPQRSPGSCHARGSGLYVLPDPRCTPGAVSPAVTQANLSSTICRSGYTRGVRPPERITETEKRQSLAAYGGHGSLSSYEYDHLVPLELGGATNDARNLWPEAGHVPNPKDALERRLNRLVCQHRLGLASAQEEIASNWVAVYRRTFG